MLIIAIQRREFGRWNGVFSSKMHSFLELELFINIIENQLSGFKRGLLLPHTKHITFVNRGFEEVGAAGVVEAVDVVALCF